MQILSVPSGTLSASCWQATFFAQPRVETESAMARYLAAVFAAALMLTVVGCNSTTAPTCPPPTTEVFTPLSNPDSLRFYPHEVDYYGNFDLLYHGNYQVTYGQGRFRGHFTEHWLAMRTSPQGMLSMMYITLMPDTSRFEYLGVLKINTGGLMLTTEGEQRIHDLFFRRDLLPSTKINMLEQILYRDPGMFRSIPSGGENRSLTPITSVRPGSEELQFLADMGNGSGFTRMPN